MSNLSVEFVGNSSINVDQSLGQFETVYRIEPLFAGGSLARAAIKGSYVPFQFPLFKTTKYGEGHVESRHRDFDAVALKGVPLNLWSPPAFWPHDVAPDLHVALCRFQDLLMDWTDPFECPIIDFPPEAAKPFTRYVNGDTPMRTFSIGVQAVMETLGPSGGKYACSTQEFLDFAAGMRLRTDVPAEEFPSDRTVELLKTLSWSISASHK